MILQKTSRILFSLGGLIGGISLSFAEGKPNGEVRWTAENPLYSQHSWEKNLLRHHVGGRLINKDEATQDGALLISDDPSIPVALAEGERVFTFSLGQRFLLRRVTFFNRGIVGVVEVATAATDPAKPHAKWVKVANHNLGGGTHEQLVKFAAVDCRYVRLTFNVDSVGEISGIGAFGIRKAVEFYDPNARGIADDFAESAGTEADDYVDVSEKAPGIPVEALYSSVTNGLGWSHVESVSSSASKDASLTSRILDEDSSTSFHFSESDRVPTVIVDLGRVCDCGRVSVLYSAGERGTMTMRLADVTTNNSGVDTARALSEFGVDAGRLRVRLERSLDDRTGRGRVTFDEFRRAGRYLILRWEGETRTRNAGQRGFGINEVSVFEHREGSETTSRKVQLREIVIETDPRGRRLTDRTRDSNFPLRHPDLGEPPVSR